MAISGEIILKKGKEFSLQRFHPWVFSGAIQRIQGNVSDGQWVEVRDYRSTPLGYGHYQEGSIAVRMMSFGEPPAADFWNQKIRAALRTRRIARLPDEGTNCFRLVHGEGDGMSGLIVDYYDGVAVMQAHSIGMHLDRARISAAISEEVPGVKAIYYKSQSTLPEKIREGGQDEYLVGMGIVPHIVLENRYKFYVDWEEGQKTGFFIDQRDNRRLLSGFTADKVVLNTFCYTGGFSVYALGGGATLVHSVDASQKAIDVARKNIELNGFSGGLHPCYAADTFDFLKDRQDQYDVIVLDPPAFAKHRNARHQAVKGYQRLNAEAIRAIKSGGIIFTFSCSQVVDRQLFYDTIVSAGIQAGRNIKVLHQLSQPADHPVSMFHPEGEYLKGLVLYVE